MAHTGYVKFFDDRKGYGFIEPVRGGADVFVHVTAVQRSGCGSINKGYTVSYDLVKNSKGKQEAANLRIVCEAW